jgi:hypothetical protein
MSTMSAARHDAHHFPDASDPQNLNDNAAALLPTVAEAVRTAFVTDGTEAGLLLLGEIVATAVRVSLDQTGAHDVVAVVGQAMIGAERAASR